MSLNISPSESWSESDPALNPSVEQVFSETHRKITCPRCGTAYRVSLTLLDKEQIQFGCRNCPEVFTPQQESVLSARSEIEFDKEADLSTELTRSDATPIADHSELDMDDQRGGPSPASRFLKNTARIIGAAFLLSAAVGVGGMWWLTENGLTPEWVLNLKTRHNLYLAEQMNGRVIYNKPNARPLIVVTGTLENRFKDKNALKWVRLVGSAHRSDSTQKILSLTYTYAGNFLSDADLGKMSWAEIRSFHNRTPKAVPDDHKLRYQLIFLAPEHTEPRHIQVKVQSYQIADRPPVYITENKQ